MDARPTRPHLCSRTSGSHALAPTHSAALLAAHPPKYRAHLRFSYSGSISAAKLLLLSKFASPGLLQGGSLRNVPLLATDLLGTSVFVQVTRDFCARPDQACACDTLQIPGEQAVTRSPNYDLAYGQGPEQLRNSPFS